MLRIVLSATDSRLFAFSPDSPGQRRSISTSLGIGRPRLTASILNRSLATFDCHADDGTGTPLWVTEKPPSTRTDSSAECPLRIAAAIERARRRLLGADAVERRRRRLGERNGFGTGHRLGDRQVDPGSADRGAELRPHRPGFVEQPGALLRVRFDRRSQLERLGERRAIAARARQLEHAIGHLGGRVLVADRQCHPAEREEGTWAGDRRAGLGRRVEPVRGPAAGSRRRAPSPSRRAPARGPAGRLDAQPDRIASSNAPRAWTISPRAAYT